ncbi:YaaA family protein [Segatella oulorum]|uniref:YaaA family protein n=1 Tax=Segatella oulorum TaxID=28136 RepID=UPI0023F2F673|nr:YaaA family protein [Segatella oulorum]
MQIILTSAKIMNAAADVAVPFATQPAFETEANELALSLASWSVAELMQAFQCSESLAHDNQQRFQSFFNAAEKLPAILAYHGEAYKHLRAETFTSAQFQQAQRHLFIISLLYGLLRPLDLIHPYRMEGNVRLPATQGQTLFAFWREQLTDVLIHAVQADDGVLVHLASAEYEHLFDWRRVQREVRVVQPLFYVEKGDKMRVMPLYAKRCRGAMTRQILQKGWQQPADLPQFAYEGFAFAPHYGDENHPHFIWKQG